MRDLTLVLPYFRNGGMLREHQQVWREMPAELKDHLHVIVVDDCSDKNKARDAAEPAGIASFRLYRNTGEKKRWNWLFARNLGMQEATTEWVLLTDIDHLMPEETCRALMTMELHPSHVYRLSRVDAPHRWPYRLAECKPYKIHPNTWLMTRKMFDKTGGYDERLSGCYGTDGEFRDRVKNASNAIVLLSDVMIRYPREIIPDASTPPDKVYTRKDDARNDSDLAQRRLDRAKLGKWQPLRVTSTWEKQLEFVEAEIPCA